MTICYQDLLNMQIGEYLSHNITTMLIKINEYEFVYYGIEWENNDLFKPYIGGSILDLRNKCPKTLLSVTKDYWRYEVTEIGEKSRDLCFKHRGLILPNKSKLYNLVITCIKRK